MLANIKNIKQAFLVNLEDIEGPKVVYDLGLNSQSNQSVESLSENSFKK